ncbi:MAG: c-type cytochrome domain-containing protein [Bacteroidota bacterium]
MNEFIGHLHPVLVHLPIGILMLACVFHIVSYHQKFAHFKTVMSVMLFWGMVCAVLSCVTGYCLSNSGDYDLKLVNLHMWMGISVAAVSLVLFILFKKVKSEIVLRIISFVLFIMICITGHLGGSLTHGSDYLSFNTAGQKVVIKPVPNVQQAVAYADLIQPLLQNKCYSCHSSEKQKGKLRLDLEAMMLKGGKNGPAVVPGNAEKSELIRRVLLTLGNDEHMPPKEKPQLSESEIALLHWWVENGADFKKKVKDLKQPAGIKTVLVSFQSGVVQVAKEISEIPKEEVKAANEGTLKRLADWNISVLPVATNSNYLSVNFVNAKSTADSVMSELAKLNKQVVWLKMDNTAITDNALKYISGMEQLIRLHLNNTKITDAGLARLKKLERLQSISLVGTTVTLNGLMQLKGLKALKNIYLYQSKITDQDRVQLKKAFPKVNIDFGNYVVPTLPADTQLYKAPEAKKP